MFGIVPSIGLEFKNDSRRGAILDLPRNESKIQSIRTLKDKLLPIAGAKLFNSLPSYLREFRG